MKVHRKRMVVLIFVLILIALPFSLQAAVFSYSAKHRPHHSMGSASVGDMETVLPGTLEDLQEFETNLPIVVVNFYGEPLAPTVWNDQKGYREPIEGDPFVEGTFALYNSAAGINRLSDAPVAETDIRARLRGNSSLSFAKSQYLIKMYDEDGTKNKQDLLGMGAEWEWILNISYIDKSLLRNYICLNLASEIMGYAPEVRFCEVFEKDEDQYSYCGVYLLMENVKRSDSRIAITEYDPHFVESSYLLCRDRYDEERPMLDTFATRQGLSAGYLGVRYPSKNEITDETMAFIEEDISRLERALYSEDINEFLAYREYVDMASAADYFIINEFFANYDAAQNSYYIYKDVGGKLTFGPVWDYDQAIDNNQPHVLETNSTAMHDAVWLRQMMRDGAFVELILERYAELRRGALSDQYIGEYIDGALGFLGKAVVRDWNRWHYDDHEVLYKDSQAGKVHPSLLSNTRDFEEEIAHVKQILQEHGAWLDENLDSLYQFSDIESEQYRATAADPALNTFFGSERANWISGSLAILLIIVFFSSIVLIQRET
ncbi:MAG: CotH kinase family protein [Christensenellales bacterium]|jgi:spore coat protein H